MVKTLCLVIEFTIEIAFWCAKSRSPAKAAAASSSGAAPARPSVEPEFLLGNINHTALPQLADSPQQQKFGKDKRDTLPGYCQRCKVRFACNGECPKNRFLMTPDGEPGLNYLCAGYKHFLHHIAPAMQIMTELLQRRLPPAGIMESLKAREKPSVR